MKDKQPRIPLHFSVHPEAEMKKRAQAFYDEMKKRRSVRDFSTRPVDREVIETCIRAAGTAPSGANQQPWYFSVVSDAAVKKEIRTAAEKVEANFYTAKGTKAWVKDLEHLGTVPKKPFLEEAPFLIPIFSRIHGWSPGGEKIKHYYVLESVGIATGILITGLHHAGLATLTYTPANMRFLNRILQRPSNEKPFMILVVGYPSETSTVPDLEKKSLDEIADFF